MGVIWYNQERMNTLTKQDGVKIKGLHIISLCSVKTDKARELEALIQDNALEREFWVGKAPTKLYELWKEYRYYVDLLHKLCKVREYVIENITTTEGRNVFARILSGNTTYTGVVSHCALGTDNTAPAITDTQLIAETYRKALSSGTFATNISYLETFFTAAEVTGTFEEYGFFIDGSGAANSGQIFNRFIQSITKSVTETMNVQSTVTWNDA